MKPTEQELHNRHFYHPPTAGAKSRHAIISQTTYDAAMTFVKQCPESRQLSLALTALEEARMWANASIACNWPPTESP